MTGKAYSFVRTFAPEQARDLCVDRHYLLCASTGALRLEAQGQAWLLPPARAALIEAPPAGRGARGGGGRAGSGPHSAAGHDRVGPLRHRIPPRPAGTVDGVRPEPP